LIRFSAYGKLNIGSATLVLATALIAFLLATRGYDPNYGSIGKIKRA